MTPDETDVEYQKCELMRKDSAVIVVLHCVDDYAAMLLYDSMADKMKNGGMELELVSKASV